jgi:hypothetical protein
VVSGGRGCGRRDVRGPAGSGDERDDDGERQGEHGLTIEMPRTIIR